MKAPRRKPAVITVVSLNLVLSVLSVPVSKAGSLYWDANGAEVGAGVSPNGEWGSDSFWNSSSNGVGATGDYVADSDVFFSAGSDAITDYTVSLSGAQSANSVSFVSTGATTIAAGGQILLGAGGLSVSNNSTINSATRLTSHQTWNIAGGTTFTQYGNLTGSFALTKAGGGTLVLGGTGGGGSGTLFTSLRISEGKVNVTGNGILGHSNIITLDDVAGVELDFSGAINSKGFGALNGGGRNGGSINATTAISFYGTAGVEGDYAGDIRGAGGFSIMSGGKQILRGNNDFRGVVSISRGGTLAFTSIGNYGSGPSSLGGQTTIAASTIKFGTATDVLDSTLEYIGTGHSSNRNFTLVGVTAGANIVANGTGALNLSGKVTSEGLGSKTLTLSGSNTDSNTFSGVIADNSTTHKTSLSKKGIGTWVLGGVNTYTGATTVEAGTLVVKGSLDAASAVSVYSGATLGGSGSIGSVVVEGALAPGNSIGTLRTGDITFGAASSFDIELGRSDGAPSSDRVDVAGNVSILEGANLNLSISGSAPHSGDLLFLIINDGSDEINGRFTRLNGVATSLSDGAIIEFNSLQWEVSYFADYSSASFTGGNDFALQAIPEPSTWALLIAAGSALALYRRRWITGQEITDRAQRG